jgi:hypothetical protein
MPTCCLAMLRVPPVASLVELASGLGSASSSRRRGAGLTSDSCPPSVVGLLRRVSGCVVLACKTSENDGDHHRDCEDPEPQEAIHESSHGPLLLVGAYAGSLAPAPEALPGPTTSRRHPRHQPRLPPRRCARARRTRPGAPPGGGGRPPARVPAVRSGHSPASWSPLLGCAGVVVWSDGRERTARGHHAKVEHLVECCGGRAERGWYGMNGLGAVDPRYN